MQGAASIACAVLIPSLRRPAGGDVPVVLGPVLIVIVEIYVQHTGTVVSRR